MSEFIHNRAELRRRGFDALVKELGYANALRFIGEYETGQGDYTRDRAEILPDWTVERWAEEANRLVHQKSQKSPGRQPQ